MPPTIALLLWLTLLLGLLYFDPAKTAKNSVALWIPVIWMFILGSRLPSQWLGGDITITAAALEDGNSVDRSVSLILMVFALGVLTSRSFDWSCFLRRNWVLTIFLMYALVSICWSDLPLVTLRKWFRDLGNYFIILIVLSDPRPFDAIRTVLRRVAYLLVPLSLLLIKYYPDMAKHYDPWSGHASFSGASTSKNTLGAMCLISGLFFFWDTLAQWQHPKVRRRKKLILVNLVFFSMTVWVLNVSNSATSRVCLCIGCLVIILANVQWSQKHPRLLKAIVPICVCLYLVATIAFNLTGELASTLGRDPTLTDRTKIWALVLGMHTNVLLGTGYESFWLGPRLDWIWRQGFGTINEAHNGYLEVYLNLGVMGLGLITALVITAYRHVCKLLSTHFTYATLGLAIWTAMLFHSVTEADFRSGLMWVTFLMITIVTPLPTTYRSNKAATASARRVHSLTTVRLEPLGPRR